VGLKLYGTHQLLIYADDVNLLGDNIDAIKKNMETLFDGSKEVGLEVNTEKTKYMLLSRHQNAGQSYYIKIPNRCFENVPKFRFGSNYNKSKPDSGGNKEETEFG
jgi:late competence protein required for DNA uptake (superfamily II DNA/RNA helicase)